MPSSGTHDRDLPPHPNLLPGDWQERLDEERAEEEADADEKVEGVDEGPALLRAEAGHEDDAVGRDECAVPEELQDVGMGHLAN